VRGAEGAGAGAPVLVLTPLWLEARALRRGSPGLPVAVCGVGPARTRAAVARARAGGARAIVMAGFCGALAPGLGPGDLVVATEVRADGRTFSPPGAAELLEALAAQGVPARPAVLASSSRPVLAGARRRLAAGGADAVNMNPARSPRPPASSPGPSCGRSWTLPGASPGARWPPCAASAARPPPCGLRHRPWRRL